MIATIITALETKRRSEGLSSNRFARKLGLDPTYWSRLRRGTQSAGAKVLLAACREYPELAGLLAEDAA